MLCWPDITYQGTGYTTGVVINMPHALKYRSMCHDSDQYATKYGARTTKCGAHATKSCSTCPKKLWHIPRKVVAHALNSCGTCPKKLWHMPRKVVAHATKTSGTCPVFCIMCHNFSGHVPQLLRACATTFQGMCQNLLWHIPSNFWHMPHFLWHVPHIL